MGYYHNILGVSETATIDDIKKAYRQKVLQFHPDLNKDHDDTKFKEVYNAYQWLLKPQKPQSSPKPQPKKSTPSWGRSRSNIKDYDPPSVDLWAQMQHSNPWEKYWAEYDRLKKETAYEEPEVFWERLQNWCDKNM